MYLLSTSLSLSLSLSFWSLQVPPPKGSHPHLLVWVPHSCSFEITTSLDLFSLLEKLSQLYIPLLLPWVTATTFLAAAGGSKQSIGVELVVIAILYSATRFLSS